MRVIPKVLPLKSFEDEAVRVHLLSEGSGYRLNVDHADGVAMTRFFTDYAEASALFDSFAEGH